MDFQTFLEKWGGRGIDFDGVYGNQCMDLMHQYCVEVLGLTDGSILAAPCAKDVYNNFTNVKGHELFDQITNTPTGVPQEGDIMFWGNGTWGHVAIFMEGNADTFTSFDQNYPTGSLCHAQNHNYTGVLGWLRLKESATTSLQAELDKARKDRDAHWNALQDIKTALAITGEYAQDVIMRRIDMLIGLEKDAGKKEEKISELTMQIQVLEKKISDQQTALESAQSQLESTVAANLGMQKTVQTLTSNNTSLQKAVQDLKDSIKVPTFRGFKKTLYDWLMKG